MIKTELNIIVVGPSLISGMAGTRRLRNIFLPIKNKSNSIVLNIDISNVRFSGKLDIDIKYVQLKYNSVLQLPGFWIRGIKVLKTNLDKYHNNILYIYGYPTLFNYLLIKSGKKLGYKIVLDIVEEMKALRGGGIKKKIKRKISILLFKRVTKKYIDLIFAISEFLVKSIKSIVPESLSVVKLPISVNLDEFNYKLDIERAENDPVIFYGGSFGEKDGLKFLIKAFSNAREKSPGIRLVLTGIGNEVSMKSFFRQVEEEQISDYVDFKGFLNDEEYIETLSKADICCVTRDNSEFANYGFPFKIGEYLAAGKAIIATKVGEIGKYLNKENAILVEPENIEQITSALTELIGSPELRSKLGAKARETAFTYFDASKQAEFVLNQLVQLTK